MITATFTPLDPALFTGSSDTESHQVNPASTTTAVSSSANPSVFGQSVTFTATVSAAAPGGGTPTGTVIFKDGGVTLGSVALSGGQATFSISSPTVGVHYISVEYSGDANYNASTGTLTQTVNKTNTSTTLTSSPNPSNIGQTVTFTATVSAASPGSGTPTGMVIFKDSGLFIGLGFLAGGQVTFSTSSLTAGDHGVTAEYSGDENFNPSTSGTLTQTVNKVNTSTGLSSSSNPSVFGQAVTFTATVSAVPPGSGTPTGTVIFKDGGSTLGSRTLSGGQATLSTSSLSAGVHDITAEYSGDCNFNASIEGPLAQTVNTSNTSTGLSSSSNPSVFGQAVTFTATVSAVPPGSGTPTGIVTFRDNSAILGSDVINGSGEATISISVLAVGAHNITAEYSGDANFNASIGGPLAQMVNKASTSTVLASSLNPCVFGQTVTFTATVSAVSPGSGTPTGAVIFKEVGSILGLEVLDGSGQAAFSISFSTAGDHNITAEYSGDTNFNASPGGPLAQTVTEAPAIQYTLNVNVSPAASGLVTGNGITCPEDCSESYGEGTTVTLSALPALGYAFDQWSGCLSPTNQCEISMDSDVSVTAHFRLSHMLNVTVVPSIGGSVMGEGIDCPHDCDEEYPDPTSVTLTALPDEGFVFTGWEGCDSMVDTQCNVYVESGAEVKALFMPESGYSMLYGERMNLFATIWMLYIPVMEVPIEGGGVEKYWLLLEYDMIEGYFRVVDYGQCPEPPQTEHSATLLVENGMWVLRIPACEVEFDPDRPYWITMEVIFADTEVRIIVLDCGLVQ